MAGRAITLSATVATTPTMTTVATCPGPGPWKITGMMAAGDDASGADRTLEVFIVPRGQTPTAGGGDYRIAADFSIPTADTLDFELFSALYLNPSDTVQMTASGAGVTGFVSLEEVAK